MRIHELLDQCVEWISHDGALGCDPTALQQYLQTQDASIDDSFFTYIWGCLAQHPSIEVVLARHPLPRPDGTILLGTAPLPDDYVPPAEVALDIEEMFSKGMRGRQIAYQLAGLEYRTSKQSMQDNKHLLAGRKSEPEAEKKVASGSKVADGQGKGKTGKGKQKAASTSTPKTSKVKREGQGAADVAPLIRVLVENDGEGEMPIPKSDLKALRERWGSRVRIRCTDQEIYYRLTGSHQQLPRISAQVLFVLQLAARSRQAGITALDLGPLLSTSQGSISYFIGVLLESNLIHKYKTALNGTSTSYIVFHKYAEQYLKHGSTAKPNQPAIVEPAASRPIDNVGDDGEDESGPSIDQTPMADLAFGPLSERDVMVGRKIEDRLVQLLEHPSLENHLLKNRELLRLLGWQGEIRPRHRRALLKLQKTMVAQGQLERLHVGPERVLCLRLTKFASEDLPMAQRVEEEPTSQADASSAAPSTVNPTDYAEPFNPDGGVPLTLTLEHQLLRHIVDSGRRGQTLSELRVHLALMFRRTIETLVARYEADYPPPHLGHFAIAPTMEFEGKEKRLRYYGIEAFRQVLAQQGQTVDEAKHPLPGPEAGRWADLSFRQFWSDRATLSEALEQGDYAELEVGPGPIGRPRKDGLPAGSTTSRYMTTVKPARARPRPTPAHSSAKREMLYDDEVQVRGRPRKYLYVVNEDGKVNRHIIGSVIPADGVAPVWIYVEEANKLVEAPRGYTGLGVPPKITAEQLKNGKTPKWFDKLERKEYGDKKKGAGKKGKAAAKGKKTKAKKDVADGDDDELMADEADEGQGVAEADEAGTAPAEAMTTGPTSANEHPAEVSAEVGSAGVKTTTNGAWDGTAAQPSEGGQAPLQAPDVEAGAKRKRGRPVAADAGQTDGAVHASIPTPRPTVPAEPIGDTTESVADVVAEPEKRGRANKRPVAEPSVPEPKPKRPRINKRAQSQVATATLEPAEAPIAVESPAPAAPQLDAAASGVEQGSVRDRSVSPALREISPGPPTEGASSDIKPVLSEPTKPIVRNGRVDLYAIRRQHELCQVLLENQGVLDKAGLYAAHTAWVKRVAGTDHPHAPISPAGMDRAVFNRTLRALFSDGRIKETNASMVVNSKWTSVPIAYLPSTSQDTVQAFIRSLASSTSQALSTPAKRTRIAKEIPAAKFTEIKVGGTPGSGTPATPALVTPLPDTLLAAPKAETRREALFKQPGLGSFLYGFQSGRFARARTLHRGIIAALSSGRLSSSIVSADSPRIFALPMMFEDIPSEAWFASILVPQYDEGLEKWLQQPENRAKPIAEVPAHICPPGGFSGPSFRTRILAVFSVLAELQLVTPLILRDTTDPADITCVDANTGTEVSFSAGEKDLQAGYYALNDVAPIYHVASDDQRLLGVSPVHTIQDADAYWSTLKQACLQPDSSMIDAIPPVSEHILPPYLTFEPSSHLSAELQQTLRHRARWSPDIRLLPVQREALQQSIDWETGRQLLTSQADIERLAWTNALPLAYVEKYLAVKGQQAAATAAERHRREREAAKQQHRRQEQSRADLRRKLEQRRAEAKIEWDQRVASAALKEGERFSPEMTEFVRKATLLATQRQALTDAMLVDAIKAYKRAKERGDDLGVGGQRTSGTFVKLPKVPKKVVIESLPDGRRRRKRWTTESDELLLDCEAILVARAGGRKNTGRSATLQVLPDLSNQVLMNRLKKILELPGQQAYFDKLVSAWTHVWLEYRGTELLPDHNPESVNDLDMVKHLAFMRERVDKAALRSSISAEAAAAAVQPASIDLAADVDTLLEQYRVEPKPHSQPHYITSVEIAISDDAKYGIMTSLSMLRPKNDDAGSPVDRGMDELRAALKTIVATPDDRFNSRTSDRILSAWPVAERTRAIESMVDDKILVRRTHHNSTGRGYIFSQSWLQSTEGPFSQDLFADAKATTDAVRQEEGLSWPIVGKAGDIAALLELVSKDEVEMSFDLDSIPSLHHHRQKYNTRRMNDDYFEFPVRVNARPTSDPSQHPATTRPLPDAGKGYFARWKDIHGRVMEAEWRKALQCALGHIVQKPGIIESSLRQMLDPVFERIEANDVFGALVDGGMARRSWIHEEEEQPLPSFEAAVLPDEAKIAWWPVGAGVFC